MSEEKNHSLKAYFKDRKFWLINADETEVELLDY